MHCTLSFLARSVFRKILVIHIDICCRSTGKEALMKELQKNNIRMDVRVLQVGDFLWIARPKGNNHF